MATVIIWLLGWMLVWAIYIACGVGVWYYWRMGEVGRFIGCICGCVPAMILLLSLGA
jgi:hypothetical protein